MPNGDGSLDYGSFLNTLFPGSSSVGGLSGMTPAMASALGTKPAQPSDDFIGTGPPEVKGPPKFDKLTWDVPSVEGMTPEQAHQLALAEHYESAGRNINNYMYDETGRNSRDNLPHTAGGYLQITDQNWRKYAPGLGIPVTKQAGISMARLASREDQYRVGLAILNDQGIGAWSKYNPRLAAALAGGQEVVPAKGSLYAGGGGGAGGGDATKAATESYAGGAGGAGGGGGADTSALDQAIASLSAGAGGGMDPAQMQAMMKQYTSTGYPWLDKISNVLGNPLTAAAMGYLGSSLAAPRNTTMLGRIGLGLGGGLKDFEAARAAQMEQPLKQMQMLSDMAKLAPERANAIASLMRSKSLMQQYSMPDAFKAQLQQLASDTSQNPMIRNQAQMALNAAGTMPMADIMKQWPAMWKLVQEAPRVQAQTNLANLSAATKQAQLPYAGEEAKAKAQETEASTNYKQMQAKVEQQKYEHGGTDKTTLLYGPNGEIVNAPATPGVNLAELYPGYTTNKPPNAKIMLAYGPNGQTIPVAVTAGYDPVKVFGPGWTLKSPSTQFLANLFHQSGGAKAPTGPPPPMAGARRGNYNGAPGYFSPDGKQFYPNSDWNVESGWST